MTKEKFVAKFAEKADETKKRSAELVDAFLEVAEKALHKHETVKFTNWGTFEVRKTSPRNGRNPNTGVSIKIPSKSVVRFKAGKGLTEKVNNKK
jgi:DNA-binding protein HU-beta